MVVALDLAPPVFLRIPKALGHVQVRIGDPVQFEPTADPEEIAKKLQRIVKEL